MYRVTAISNDVIFDENFVSATSRTLPVRNKDGELLRTFPLYTSPLTRQPHMDWTGTLSNIFGSSAQQTYSDDNSLENSENSSANDSQNLSDPTEISNSENSTEYSESLNNPSDPTEILNSQDSLESTQINPPQHSEESALLSILFEGGG